jgi:UDP-N-acetylmuramoylalanine--D-glutamate ligase
VTALVEGFSRDALAVARLLATEGRHVRLAGAGPAPAGALALRELGVVVEEQVDLDRAAPAEESVYFDVWTPEVAPRVACARAAGAQVTCLADLLLERARLRTIGVTGTAGKTSTTHLLVHLLSSAGVPVVASTASPSANLWPDEEHLSQLEHAPGDALLVVELTSSHLAFMSRSPEIAVVTCFWPDHLELHGSLARYREAKETIVRHQRDEDAVVLDPCDEAVRPFLEHTPARLHPIVPLPFPPPPGLAFEGRRLGNVLAACAAALAAGVSPAALEEGLRYPPAPPSRARVVGRTGSLTVVDDSMAATPGKARATLESFAEHSLVLVCGGEREPVWGAVHASPDETAELERACDAAARAARDVVVFGTAALRLVPMLSARGVRFTVAGQLEEAIREALRRTRGATGLVLSPMFPLTAVERARASALLRDAVGGIDSPT